MSIRRRGRIEGRCVFEDGSAHLRCTGREFLLAAVHSKDAKEQANLQCSIREAFWITACRIRKGDGCGERFFRSACPASMFAMFSWIL